MAKLNVTDDNTGLTVLLVGSHCGYPFSEVDRVAPELSIQTADGDKYKGLSTVCNYIASHTSSSAALLGQTPEHQAQVRLYCAATLGPDWFLWHV